MTGSRPICVVQGVPETDLSPHNYTGEGSFLGTISTTTLSEFEI